MTTANGFFPVIFQSSEPQLLDVAPVDCQLRVIIRKYEDGPGYYFDADALDLTTDSTDAWYDFIEFAADPQAFESLGWLASPDCARFDGATWVFDTLVYAIIWAKRFAIDGLGVEQSLGQRWRIRGHVA